MKSYLKKILNAKNISEYDLIYWFLQIVYYTSILSITLCLLMIPVSYTLLKVF